MSEEEKKKVEAEEANKAEAEKKSEGEDKKEEEEKFVEGDEKVDKNKFNQALRKAREAEAEKREIEKEKARLEQLVKKGTVKKEAPAEKKEEKEEEDDFWGEEKKEEKKVTPDEKLDQDSIKDIIDEQIRPFIESETNRKKLEKKKARESFYEKHPEYLNEADKWAELLDELNGSIVPSGDYYQDLEKAHRIIGGEDFNQVQIEQKKKEIANDAGTGDGGSVQPQSSGGEYKASAMDKKIMEGTGVSADVIKKMRQMEKDGTLSLEF